MNGNPFYGKIETVFQRDMEGTKRLMPGKFRNPCVEWLQNNEWEFTEKIDGTNIRVDWDGHRVTWAGHTERSQIPAKLNDRLREIFGSEETEELFEQKFGESEVTFYGEGFGAGIAKVGGLYSKEQNFILFDVLIGGYWLERPNVEDIAKAFDIPVVPVVLTGTINDAVEFVKTRPMSTIGTAPMEGVVGRPKVGVLDRCGHRLIVKIKVHDHADPLPKGGK